MYTTIQLRQPVKKRLQQLKQQGETYEDVIVRVLDTAIANDLSNPLLLKRAYVQLRKCARATNKEWETSDAQWD